MTSIETPADGATSPSGTTIHPLLVRITHWINAAAILVMIGSGLEIHNAHRIVPFLFPSFLTLGGWLGGALLWHFAAMWVLAANFLVMIAFGILSGRYWRKLFPLTPGSVIRDVKAALTGRLAHADLSVYNAVQRLLYLGVLLAIALAIISGLAIWKPVQFQEVTALLGGFDAARVVHFLAMSAIAGFVLVHVAMALIVPKSLKAMILGR